MLFEKIRRLLIAAALTVVALAPNRGLADDTTASSAPPDSGNGLRTFSEVGKELHVLDGGKEAQLLYHEGRGCLTHMWFGGDFPGFAKTRIRVYVDGEPEASIDMEMGLGMGVGFDDPAAPWGIARMGKTGHPSGIYNTFHVPFGKSVRVTAQLGAGIEAKPLFWWIIRGTDNLPVEVGGVRLPPTARLKLYKIEEKTFRRLEEFDLCKTDGAGALYLVFIAAHSDEGNLNYLEAQMRAYVDGSDKPVFLSSGLEDYFLGTYYFNRGLFQNPVAGLTHIDHKDNSFSAYRFHDDDPFFFDKGLRLTCRCGEQAGEHVFGNPQPTTYTTYTWVYEW